MTKASVRRFSVVMQYNHKLSVPTHHGDAMAFLDQFIKEMEAKGYILIDATETTED